MLAITHGLTAEWSRGRGAHGKPALELQGGILVYRTLTPVQFKLVGEEPIQALLQACQEALRSEAGNGKGEG